MRIKGIYKKLKKLNKIRPGDHSVLLYEKEKELIASTAAFIESSLNRDEKCFYIEGDVAADNLLLELKNNIESFEEYIKSEQLVIMNREQSYSLGSSFQADKMLEFIISKTNSAVEEGYKGLSITGELSWNLTAEEDKKEIIDYEWKLNKKVFNKYPVTALCRYNINKFDQEIIKAIIELHKYVIWNGNIHENPYYIEPEAYRDNKIVEYEIKSWLKNIQQYEKKKSIFKNKIKEKDAKYKELFHSAPIGIIQITTEGEILSINETISEMLGFSSREKAVQHYQDLIKDVYGRTSKISNLLEKLNEEKEVKNFQFSFFKKDGQQIFLSMNAKLKKKSGKDYDLIEGFVSDITETKKAKYSLKNKREEVSALNEQLSAYNEEIMDMNSKMNEAFNEVAELNRRFETMITFFANGVSNSNLSETDFMKDLLQTSVELIPEADYGSVYKYQNSRVEFIETIGYNFNDLAKIEIPAEAFYNQNGFIEILSLEEVRLRNSKYMDPCNFRDISDSSYKMKELMSLDLEIKGVKKIGLSVDIAEESDSNFSENSKKIFEALYELLSAFYKDREYNRLHNSFTKELVNSIIKLLEMYDLYTKGHSENVANLSREIALAMGLSDEEVENSYWAGLVHDIGKLLVPLEILNKKDGLTKSEYEVIKEHPVFGANSLSNSDSLKRISKFVRHHHERWDGNGYPDGLVRDEIPLISQIITVADAWDAMTSKRSYRDPLTILKAKKEIIENSGLQFSPKVVNIFLDIIDGNI